MGSPTRLTAMCGTWIFAVGGVLVALGTIMHVDWLFGFGITLLVVTAVFAGVLAALYSGLLAVEFLALPFTTLMRRR